MSQRISPVTSLSVLPALVLGAILSAPAWGGDPNRAPDPNAASGKKMVAQTKTVLPNKPAPPAPRGPALLTREMPFSQAIDILRNATTPPLNIIVLWKEIGENAGIRRETPIGIDGVPGLRIGQCLELLMLSLSAGAPAQLGYVVRNGAVTIATTDTLRTTKSVPRIYDISDLVAPPAQYFGGPFGFGGMGMSGMGYGGMGRGGAGYGGPGIAPFGGSVGSLGAGSGAGAPLAPVAYRRR